MFRLSPHSKSYLALHSKFILMPQRGINKNEKFDSFSCPAVQHDSEILTNLTYLDGKMTSQDKTTVP